MGSTARLISVNIGVPRPNPAKSFGVTGIDKRPTEETVWVRPPGPRGPGRPGSGLVGDQNFDTLHHGGDDRAVYAYAREDLDFWEAELSRPLANGNFGENLTTQDFDANGALIGERWRVGDDVVLEVTGPRVPCGTFVYWMPERGWMKTFVRACRPGPYLKVLEPGRIRVGDRVVVEERPAHGVSIVVAFKAMMMGDKECAERVLALPGISSDVRNRIIRVTGGTRPIVDGVDSRR